MLRQLTEAEAIAMGKGTEWEGWSLRHRAVFQLRQEKLCMPFDVFHEAVEKTLGRPVYTHEFGLNWQGLLDEAMGKVDAPSLAEIIAMLPQEKLIVVVPEEEKE